MANIKYRHILNNKELLTTLCIRKKKSIDEAARIVKVPYNCFLNQCKKMLEPEEMAQIPRKRKKYSLSEKICIIKRMQEVGISKTVKEFGLAPIQIRTFIEQLKQIQAERRAAKPDQ